MKYTLNRLQIMSLKVFHGDANHKKDVAGRLQSESIWRVICRLCSIVKHEKLTLKGFMYTLSLVFSNSLERVVDYILELPYNYKLC